MGAFEVVVSAFGERNIPVKRDEITSALSADSSGVRDAEWVQQRITPDTLLSEEELRLFLSLESSGSLPAIFSDPNFDSMRPFLDEDLQNAIEALNISTAKTQRQINIMKSQYDVYDRQNKRDEYRESRQNREVERLRQKHDAARQNTSAAVSELAHELEISLKNEVDRLTLEGKKTLSALTTRLKEDDKLLSDLEGLAAGVKSSDGDAIVMKRTTELSSILAQYVAEEIYCRLDRIYLGKVLDARKESFSSGKDVETVAGLEQEMESLYSEIDILANMSIKQQFVEPILRQLQNQHGQLRIASHQKLNYILEMVTSMTTSAESLITDLQDRESFCTTLETFASTYRSQVGEQILDSTSSRRETMRRFSKQPAPMAIQSGKKSSAFPEPDSLSGLLRRLGLSSEGILKAEALDGGTKLLTQERQHMLEDLHNYGIASDSPLAAELLPMHRATILLSSALSADSHFSASLSSEEHERSLTELESKLSRIQKGIQTLNQDVVYQRDKNQEIFLERWG